MNRLLEVRVSLPTNRGQFDDRHLVGKELTNWRPGLDGVMLSLVADEYDSIRLSLRGGEYLIRFSAVQQARFIDNPKLVCGTCGQWILDEARDGSRIDAGAAECLHTAARHAESTNGIALAFSEFPDRSNGRGLGCAGQSLDGGCPILGREGERHGVELVSEKALCCARLPDVDLIRDGLGYVDPSTDESEIFSLEGEHCVGCELSLRVLQVRLMSWDEATLLFLVADLHPQSIKMRPSHP